MALVAAAALAISLDGRPVVPAPRVLVVAGRTLLGIRSLGDALGAAVGYDARAHRVTVERDGRQVSVPVARIVDGRAFAGLRNAARAFDFDVTYDAARHAVALRSPHRSAPTAAAVDAPPAIPAMVTQKFPQPGGEIADAFPAISARVEPQGGAPVDAAAIRLSLDGQDVTGLAAIIGDEIVYTPHVPLGNGRHTVHVGGVDRGGVAFGDDWSFASNYVPPSNAPSQTGLSSVFLDRIPRLGERFFDVIAYGPPGGYGFVTVDGVPGQFGLVPQGISRYVAHVVVPLGVDLPYAHAVVHYVDGQGGSVNYTIPSTLRLYTIGPVYAPNVVAPAQPAASPVPTPTAIPAMPHRTFVRPPAPTPAPDATHVPALLVHPAASPTATPVTHKRFLLGAPPVRATPTPHPTPSPVPRATNEHP